MFLNDLIPGDGKSGFRKDGIKVHNTSFAHSRCMAADRAQESPKTTPMAMVIKKMNESQRQHLNILFNTAYYVAKQKLAFVKFSSLCDLQVQNGIQLNAAYNNAPACKDFLSSIAATIKAEINSEVVESNFISVIADGSTDKSIIEQEGVYIRYVKSGKPTTKFVELVDVETSDAPGVYSGIQRGLKSIGITLDILKQKLVCINLDGASVNMGKKGGVQALVKRDIPHTIAVHCVNHNLELAILDMKNQDPYMLKFESTLKEIFKLYYYSTKRRRELYTVAEILDQKLMHYGGLKEIRWLSSQHRAVKALAENYNITVTHLENMVSTSSGVDAAKAKGILKELKTEKFAKLLFFLQDYLNILGRLSVLFQSDEMLIMNVVPMLEETMLHLQNLLAEPEKCINLKKFEKQCNDGTFPVKLTNVGKANMQPIYSKLIDNAVKYMDSRFDTMQSPPYSHFAVFDFTKWPYSQDELASYGDSDIDGLVTWFAQILTPQQRENAMSEWLTLKIRLSKMRTSVPSEVYCDLLRTPVVNPSVCNIQSILILVNIMYAISVSSAAAERGFSDMNLTKTKLRSVLEQDSINNLMTITINGPDMKDFKPDSAICHWMESGPGSRHIQTLNKC